MTVKQLSILRDQQYDNLSRLSVNGSILDLGGSRKSGYHELVGGEHVWTVVNYGDQHPGADLNFNIEEKFPLQDASYDNVVTMNVLEHIFEYQNVFAEVARVIKPGGLFISSVPFMHQVHGSPDDYHRYTASTYKKLADKYGFEIISLETLGYGLFSFIYQCIGAWCYFDIMKTAMKNVAIALDKLLRYIPKYNKLANVIPLGFFWVMKKR